MDDAQAMRRALELATRGPAKDVNPQVGCVILAVDGAVLAHGWHRGLGTVHAEVDALNKLSNDAARGSTVVVTLEPCNHRGHAGACTRALIEAGVGRVVYGVTDPGSLSGGGGERLQSAGIQVTAGVLEEDVTALISEWLTVARLRRPIITVKWASSLDGRTAAHDGSSQWITGPGARADVHKRRANVDAIVVGTGTVLADDPALTARKSDDTLMSSQPIPVVIGNRSVPDNAKIRAHPRELLTFPGDDLQGALADLRDRGIRTALVEGGPTLSSAFIRAGFVDEYLIYLAPTILGGDRLAIGDIGITTIDGALRLGLESVERCGDDIRVVAKPHSVQPMKGQ